MSLLTTGAGETKRKRDHKQRGDECSVEGTVRATLGRSSGDNVLGGLWGKCRVCSTPLMVVLANQARLCVPKGRHNNGRTQESQSIARVSGSRAVNEGKGGIITRNGARSESEL